MRLLTIDGGQLSYYKDPPKEILPETFLTRE